MKSLRNQKGITLVALVVTIIVLLILAGVSLSLVAGSNGIMNKASDAVKRSDIASAEERAELEIVTALTQYYDEYYAQSQNVDLDTVIIREIGTNKPVGKNATLKAEEVAEDDEDIAGIKVNGKSETFAANKLAVKFTVTLTGSKNKTTAVCFLDVNRNITDWIEKTPTE